MYTLESVSSDANFITAYVSKENPLDFYFTSLLLVLVPCGDRGTSLSTST